jgi:hypothetical protein
MTIIKDTEEPGVITFILFGSLKIHQTSFWSSLKAILPV